MSITDKFTDLPYKPFDISPKDFAEAVLYHIHSSIGTDKKKASKRAWWMATCCSVNELVFSRLYNTQKTHYTVDTRAVNYMSLEFLIGRLLANNLHNLNLYEIAERGLAKEGINLADLCEEEPDMALGNGGLGRLAACFLDSLATQQYPAIGYGIHYEHGLFRQEFRDGRQIERPDSWREYGNPWEICRPESIQEVPLYGYVETVKEKEGIYYKKWHPAQNIKGVPWDIPIVGYGGQTVNILRLWESRAAEFFNWDVFNAGGYVDAQRENAEAEAISKVLYPNDETAKGKELRLIQQYFFSACSLKDIIRRYKRFHDSWDEFADQVVIQLNDTHPVISIPEMIRILVDEEKLPWDKALDICHKVFNFTCHTLLPEAHEKWSVELLGRVLPRHLEIIYAINAQFLATELETRWPGDDAKKSKLSIIEENHVRMVRMTNLAVIMCEHVNGVAEIHSKLLITDHFPEFYQLFPEKFTNVTNGVTPRRWLKSCNPGLAGLITEKIGEDWPVKLDHLKRLVEYADDSEFQSRFMAIKKANKEMLAREILKETGIQVDTGAIFDVQIKRLHEYKRQHLNLLHIMTLYKQILDNPQLDIQPRLFLFGAKAAPGYIFAKEIIYAINRVAQKINSDPVVNGRIKVIFLPNYRVSLAEKMIPATDVSEQISTAGMEASGTGNMKFALNGALTVGTLDGANIEIAEEVGAANIFIFGLNIGEVKNLKKVGYNPWDYYNRDPMLKEILDWFDTDYFTPGQTAELAPLKRQLLRSDPYLVLADYASYCAIQQEVDAAYRQKSHWAKMAIMNTAMVGKFNSDRAIKDYVERIWKLKKCKITSKYLDHPAQ